MSDARPHLVAIGGQAAESGSSPGATDPAPATAGPAGLNRAAWLAGALALLCAIGWGMQSREGRALEQELARTNAALASSQARVTALEGQKARIHEDVQALTLRTGGLVDQMGALLGDLGALGDFAASDPEGETPADLPAAP